MKSPLARAIISLLGAYVLLMLFLVARDWIREEYPTRPKSPVDIERIQHPYHHEKMLQALVEFKGLPQSERDKIRENLGASLISMEEWTRNIDDSNYCLICLGESHNEATRTFLAREFFPRVAFDTFLVEATPRELKRILKRFEAGREYFPLLEADILAVLRSVKARNREIRIYGIEQTKRQKQDQQEVSGSRDRSITRNFWDKFQADKRHLILFGALHCTDEENWLYGNIRSQASPEMHSGMLNICVLGEHQNGPVEAFVYFLDELGFQKSTFVITNAGDLHPKIKELFQPLQRQVFEKYSTLIVFR